MGIDKLKRELKCSVPLRTVLDSIDIVPTDRKRTENVFTLSVLFSLQLLTELKTTRFLPKATQRHF